jgi:hypothetical protein
MSKIIQTTEKTYTNTGDVYNASKVTFTEETFDENNDRFGVDVYQHTGFCAAIFCKFSSEVSGLRHVDEIPAVYTLDKLRRFVALGNAALAWMSENIGIKESK